MSIKIMAAVWELDLPRDEKIVALAFADHADDLGCCYPGIERVAWKCGYSGRSVQRKVIALTARGVLLIVAHDGGGRGKATVYQIVPEKGRQLHPFTPPVKGDNLSKGDTRVPERVTPVSGKGDTPVTPTIKEPSKETNTCVPMWDTWKKITGLDGLKLTDNRKRRLKAVTRHLKPLAVEHDTTVARLWTLMVEAVWEDPWRREQRSRHDPVNVFRSAEQMETWVDKAVAQLRVERGTERTSTETADRRVSVDATDLRRDTHHAALKEWWDRLNRERRDDVNSLRDKILTKDFPGQAGTLSGIRKVCMVRAMEQVSGIEEPKEEERHEVLRQ